MLEVVDGGVGAMFRNFQYNQEDGRLIQFKFWILSSPDRQATR